MNEKTLDISVIMPALNEEKNIASAIEQVLKAMHDFNIEGELIVINDGSTDKTGELISGAMAKAKNVRTILHEKPRGIGASFWEGVDSAEADIVVMLPGDNENDPGEILRYYGLTEHVDMVIPFIFNKMARSIFRNALSFIYRFIINTTFLVNFNYTNGTVIYRKSILQELDYRSDGFFFQTDILIRSVKKGYLFAEVPYKLGARGHGKSKAVSFPSLIRVTNGYLILVKDFYFRKNDNDDLRFASDSQTALRRGFGNDRKD